MLFQLFGPRWNTSVPRFAANLGFSPLEPVQASQSSPTPQEPSRELPPEVGKVVVQFLSCSNMSRFCLILVSDKQVNCDLHLIVATVNRE
jgi:hypothetical protein